jgi:hypothetical protein
MSRPPNLDKRFMETFKFWMFELRIIKPKEVVHDDISRECWKSIREVQWLFACFKFLHADGQRVDVPVDDVYEVEDGAAREPCKSKSITIYGRITWEVWGDW